MSLDIQNFVQIAQSPADDRQTILIGDAEVKTVGRLHSAFVGNRARLESTRAFLDALRIAYGDFVANMAEQRLHDELQVGAPFTVLKLREITAEANQLRDRLSSFVFSLDATTGKRHNDGLKQAMDHWFALHPAPNLTPDARAALEAAIADNLSRGEPRCANVQAMYEAVATGLVSPLKENLLRQHLVAQQQLSSETMRATMRGLSAEFASALADAEIEQLRDEILARHAEATDGLAHAPASEAEIARQLNALCTEVLEEYLDAAATLAPDASPEARRAALFEKPGEIVRLRSALPAVAPPCLADAELAAALPDAVQLSPGEIAALRDEILARLAARHPLRRRLLLHAPDFARELLTMRDSVLADFSARLGILRDFALPLAQATELRASSLFVQTPDGSRHLVESDPWRHQCALARFLHNPHANDPNSLTQALTDWLSRYPLPASLPLSEAERNDLEQRIIAALQTDASCRGGVGAMAEAVRAGKIAPLHDIEAGMASLIRPEKLEANAEPPLTRRQAALMQETLHARFAALVRGGPWSPELQARCETARAESLAEFAARYQELDAARLDLAEREFDALLFPWRSGIRQLADASSLARAIAREQDCRDLLAPCFDPTQPDAGFDGELKAAFVRHGLGNASAGAAASVDVGDGKKRLTLATEVRQALQRQTLARLRQAHPTLPTAAVVEAALAKTVEAWVKRLAAVADDPRLGGECLARLMQEAPLVDRRLDSAMLLPLVEAEEREATSRLMAFLNVAQAELEPLPAANPEENVVGFVMEGVLAAHLSPEASRHLYDRLAGAAGMALKSRLVAAVDPNGVRRALLDALQTILARRLGLAATPPPLS